MRASTMPVIIAPIRSPLTSLTDSHPKYHNALLQARGKIATISPSSAMLQLRGPEFHADTRALPY